MRSFTAEAIAAAGVFGDGAGKKRRSASATQSRALKTGRVQGVGRPRSARLAGICAPLATACEVMDSLPPLKPRGCWRVWTGAGKAIALIGSGVESITKLHDFETIPQSAILAFEDSLWRAFEEMVQVSEGWTGATPRPRPLQTAQAKPLP